MSFQKKQLGGAGQQEGRHGKSHHGYLQVMSEHEPIKERPVSIKELAQHNTADSAWLSLNGVVYDVTTYLKFHPGGKILLEGCGKECSSLFNKYHPWVNGPYLLAKYKLGPLAP